MWMVNPRWMCDQHLLGEHVECHMFAGSINKGKSVQGYINKGLLELHNLRRRHGEVATERNRRNMNHKSPFPTVVNISFCSSLGEIDRMKNLAELMCRCPDCRARFVKVTGVKKVKF